MRFLLVALLATTACAAGQVQAPPLNPAEKKEAAKVSSDDYQEEITYRASLDRIAEKFIREKGMIETCLTDGSSSKTCFKLQKGYCEISQVLDSRGTMHHKPYCD